MTSERQPANLPPPRRTLAEIIRQGLAPANVRWRGACGEVPGTAAEKIEILLILSEDEEEISQKAISTLLAWPSSDLRCVLSDPNTSPELLITAARILGPRSEDALESLLQNPALDAGIQNALIAALAGQNAGDSGSADPEIAAPPEHETAVQKIRRMTPAQKIKCALMGTQEERFLLIRDSNKAVARAVLHSPKLSEAETEAYASMKNISEEVLRVIASNRSFIKNYVIVRALVGNSRAPIDVTLPLLPRLNDRDMRALAVNKNVPDALRTTAAKALTARQSSRGPVYRRH